MNTPGEILEAIEKETREIPDEDLQAKTEGNDDDLDTLQPVPQAKIDSAMAIIEEAATHGKTALAFSGGSDSMVLLDLAAKTEKDIVVVWADSQMEYPETRAFIRETVESRGLQLRIATATRTPLQQWQRNGWPMLGKQPARLWNQANAGAGFKCNVSECCRTMKISPARTMTKNLGCSAQMTGQKGIQDDALRGTRGLKDGAVFYQVRDRMWIANPLTGWTNEDITAYRICADLPEHPARSRGAKHTGCVFCGGGAQYTNSRYRILRKTWPEAWNRFMVKWGGGLVILSIKYKSRLDDTRVAVDQYGGLYTLAAERPWIFDFLRIKPLKGWAK